MFNFITVGDVHSADKNPGARVGDYFIDTFDKLDQIAIIAEKVKADAVFFLGDIFHIKQQKENSCKLIANWIELLKTYPPTIGIAGNHDESFNNPETIPNQPIGVLEASGHLTLLDEKLDKHYIFEKAGIKIRVAGYPYEKKLGISACDIKKKDEDILIALAHIYAGPKEKDLFGETIYGYDKMVSFNPDIFCFGHYHVDQGVRKKGTKYFINLGAITRGSISKDDLERKPKVGWISINEKREITIKQIKLKVKPSNEIFNLELKEEIESENDQINAYIEKLKSEIEGTKVEANIAKQIGSLDLSTEVKDMVYHYLEKAGLEKGEIESSDILANITLKGENDGDS